MADLKGQDQPHATCQQVDVNLHEVVARARLEQFEEVQGDRAAPAGRNREGEEETCWWPVLGLGLLARWALGNEGIYVCSEAWPPYQAPSQSHGLVAVLEKKFVLVHYCACELSREHASSQGRT